MRVCPSLSPLQTAIAQPRNCSPLNPSVQIHASKQQQNPPTITTKIHLSNLDKLLQKPTPPSDQTKLTSSSSLPSASTNRRLVSPLRLSFQSSSDTNQSEAMSPRSLNHLQQLLSDSEPSPRGNISQNWRKYHGCDNWVGLLDPLDPHLRREILRCGDLVQSAYNTYFSHPPNKVSLSDQSYRVTSSLFATSSVQLPQWFSSVVPWFSTQRSSWIGYVAVCDDEREIRRMGRRDITIVLRGTATCLEWAENFRAGLVPIEPNEKDGAKVECGFWSLYKTPGDSIKSLSSSVVTEVQRLLNKYKGEELSITVTGHSLGAALSVLVADELSKCKQDMPPISVFSFGGPRVGNRAFVNRVESRGVKVLRVVNAHDMVTRVPGLLPREHIHEQFEGGWQEQLLERLDGYVHVGRELRVDSRMSPVLRPDADLACCHDLEAYLHLVDGFMATNCPFRVNARRSLVRLLNQQGGNVKQVFISKAKAVHVQLDLSAGKTAIEEQLSHPSSLFSHQRLIESK
ncbi:Alpha/beta-Hydrolases superfamily protein [Rhynchospora pubera]|uniref:Alpha/beta-Hydrolases superfamily protein n=1 Tax=Rhynchospora pubera TaxID=906938 RepID=A0AAV8EX43_9POAL|nr:Alpha/beta-Hydrolases superfamily protein [Rhynchospora pubera]